MPVTPRKSVGRFLLPLSALLLCLPVLPALAADGYTPPVYQNPTYQNPVYQPAATQPRYDPKFYDQQPGRYSGSGRLCDNSAYFRYDYGFGSRKADHAVSANHRLYATYNCVGVVLEHTGDYLGMTPGNTTPAGTLWMDRVALVGAAVTAQGEVYLSLGQTSMYGLHHARTTTVGLMITDRSQGWLAADLAVNLPANKLFKGNKMLDNPAEADAELALRLEVPHAALRLGYRVMKTLSVKRGIWFAGYSLSY